MRKHILYTHLKLEELACTYKKEKGCGACRGEKQKKKNEGLRGCWGGCLLRHGRRGGLGSAHRPRPWPPLTPRRKASASGWGCGLWWGGVGSPRIAEWARWAASQFRRPQRKDPPTPPSSSSDRFVFPFFPLCRYAATNEHSSFLSFSVLTYLE